MIEGLEIEESCAPHETEMIRVPEGTLILFYNPWVSGAATEVRSKSSVLINLPQGGESDIMGLHDCTEHGILELEDSLS